ncbi:MAG: hypothetical protein R3B89_24775 [Polyangiaceae bacterium]
MHTIIEGVDGVGKDSLVRSMLDTEGYRVVIHYSKPLALDVYQGSLRRYQEDSFRGLFGLLLADTPIIFNRSHVGEFVYAPRYRSYAGDYVFELEREYLDLLGRVRLILLVEDFEHSFHFTDDGESLGTPSARRGEQASFLEAFELSSIPLKRKVCVTDTSTGRFRHIDDIRREALGE